jgi:hypothetical protein
LKSLLSSEGNGIQSHKSYLLIQLGAFSLIMGITQPCSDYCRLREEAVPGTCHREGQGNPAFLLGAHLTLGILEWHL